MPRLKISYIIIPSLLSIGIYSCGYMVVNTKVEKHTAVIESIRMTFESKEQRSGGDAVSGAVVGGFIAGTMGAIIGASSGSSESVMIKGELAICKFVAQLDNEERIIFTYQKYDVTNRLYPCSTLREKDTITLRKIINPFSNPYYEW